MRPFFCKLVLLFSTASAFPSPKKYTYLCLAMNSGVLSFHAARRLLRLGRLAAEKVRLPIGKLAGMFGRLRF